MAAAGLSGVLLKEAWEQLGREDLIPGEPPNIQLAPRQWPTSPDELHFAAIGDNGSGGRQAMAVAEELARSYQEVPFGLLSMLGDIVYYGPISRRFEDVFLEPLGPMIEAGVRFEIAVGNHDGELFLGDERLEEVERTLDLLGTPARYYQTSHGPVDFFYLDSVAMVRRDAAALRQVAWLDAALTGAGSTWRIVCLHHPVHSSGRHGPHPVLRELLEPVLVRHGVDLVLSGHDHHYERTVPIDGVTYVVSGAGCKLTPVDPEPFTAFAVSTLQFLRLHATRERLRVRSIGADGALLDEVVLAVRDDR